MTVATLILEIYWLGQVALCLDGIRVEPIKPSRKADALLAYLALNAGMTHERSKLMDMFCVNVKDPASDFRGILMRVREMVGKGITEQFYTIDKANGESALRFESKPGLRIDALEFRKPFGHTPSIEDLISKAALYHGPFMPGYESVDSIGWLAQMQAGLDAQFCELMKRLLDELFAAERWADMVIWAEHWIARSDLPRDAYNDMMAAYSELGDLPKLDATYKRYARALSDLGTAPSEELQRQYEFWRKALVDRYSKPSINVRPTPPVTQSEVPQPKPLPQPPTSFIGRMADLARIDERLGDAECQLVVLLGIGGLGKTRLALHAAQLARANFEDGVAYVNLGQVTSDERFAASLADALNFTPYGQEPLLAQVQNYLREKHLLIVFDAFEHVIQEWTTATDGAQLLDELLNAAPGVKALVTSRERLNLPREYALPIEGLDYPPAEVSAEDADADDDEIESYGAIKLFLRTARRVRNDFSLHDEKAGVVRICRRAQGLPLAIDLAAVHVAGMSAADIADAIDSSLDVLEASGAFAADEDPRHRSMRATFEYSWKMLPLESQKVYAQLSIFAGSFSREAALSVVDAPQRVLSALVGNTLLRYDFRDRRYDLHDLLRQFAAEKLQGEELSDAALPTRMADYYLSFARRNQNRYAELEPEWSNFLAAMRHAHAGARWQTVMDFAEVLGDAWFTRARYTDMRLGMMWANNAAQELNTPLAIATSLLQMGRTDFMLDEQVRAKQSLTTSSEIFLRLGDLRGYATAQFHLGQIAIEDSAYDDAHELFETCRDIYEELNDQGGVGEALYGQARICRRNHDFENARALAFRAVEIQQSLHATLASIKSLRLLAEILSEAGDQAQAMDYCQQALRICDQLQDFGEQANTLHVLTTICRRRREYAIAQHHANQCLTLLRYMGDRRMQGHVILEKSYIAKASQDYLTALAEGRLCLSIYRNLQDNWCAVYAMQQLGDVHHLMGEKNHAKAQWSAALEIAKPLNHPLMAELTNRLAKT